jgi:hypothetical protein
MQRLAVPGAAAVQLGHPRPGVSGAAGALPGAAAGYVSAIGVKTLGCTGTVLAIQPSLLTP